MKEVDGRELGDKLSKVESTRRPRVVLPHELEVGLEPENGSVTETDLVQVLREGREGQDEGKRKGKDVGEGGG